MNAAVVGDSIQDSDASRPGPAAALRAVDRRLVAPGSMHRFACVRTAFAVIIGLRLALRRWDLLAEQPIELFRPVFIVSWLSQVPAAALLVAAEVLGMVCAALAALRRRPVMTLAVAWAMLLFLAGLRTSAGKILHNDVLLLLAAVPILFGPAAAAIGDRRRSSRAGWPVRSALIVVGSVYLVAGVQKLRHSGLDWVTTDNFRWVLYSGAASGRAPVNGVALAIADRPWLAHLAAAGLLAFELLALLLLAVRRTRPVVVVLAVAFHGGTWLTLGLDYWVWILTVAAVALPWDRWGDRGAGGTGGAGRAEGAGRPSAVRAAKAQVPAPAPPPAHTGSPTGRAWR